MSVVQTSDCFWKLDDADALYVEESLRSAFLPPGAEVGLWSDWIGVWFCSVFFFIVIHYIFY